LDSGVCEEDGISLTRLEDTQNAMKKTINVKGRLLDLSTPAVMGILNLTPDSFYDGGALTDLSSVIRKTEEMLAEGAAIIDIGAQSTRPGADYLSAAEEWSRLEAPLKELSKRFPDAAFSIDTFHAEVAERAIGCGAAMVNDVTGGTMDDRMFATVARLRVPYVLMHIRGTPKTMQQTPMYSDVVREVFEHLLQRYHALRNLDVTDIIIDPGFGFGKTLEQNYALLRALPFFSKLDAPVLAGLSRKSMVNRVLGTAPEDALNGTTVLNVLALAGGASLLRVHDVREAAEAVKLVMYYRQQEASGLLK
jgi:dihydropteroate synthase